MNPSRRLVDGSVERHNATKPIWMQLQLIGHRLLPSFIQTHNSALQCTAGVHTNKLAFAHDQAFRTHTHIITHSAGTARVLDLESRCLQPLKRMDVMLCIIESKPRQMKRMIKSMWWTLVGPRTHHHDVCEHT